MLKKLLLVFGLLAALSVAPAAMAQLPATQEEMMAAFAKESPLTQKDIDGYIKILPKMQDAAADQDKALALFKEGGFTEIRGAYAISKISVALMSSELGDQAEAMMAQVPEAMRPSAAEIELVKSNIDKIKAAVSQ